VSKGHARSAAQLQALRKPSLVQNLDSIPSDEYERTVIRYNLANATERRPSKECLPSCMPYQGFKCCRCNGEGLPCSQHMCAISKRKRVSNAMWSNVGLSARAQNHGLHDFRAAAATQPLCAQVAVNPSVQVLCLCQGSTPLLRAGERLKAAVPLGERWGERTSVQRRCIRQPQVR
jgi:hypothetical protein